MRPEPFDTVAIRRGILAPRRSASNSPVWGITACNCVRSESYASEAAGADRSQSLPTTPSSAIAPTRRRSPSATQPHIRPFDALAQRLRAPPRRAARRRDRAGIIDAQPAVAALLRRALPRATRCRFPRFFASGRSHRCHRQRAVSLWLSLTAESGRPVCGTRLDVSSWPD